RSCAPAQENHPGQREDSWHAHGSSAGSHCGTSITPLREAQPHVTEGGGDVRTSLPLAGVGRPALLVCMRSVPILRSEGTARAPIPVPTAKNNRVTHGRPGSQESQNQELTRILFREGLTPTRRATTKSGLRVYPFTEESAPQLSKMG